MRMSMNSDQFSSLGSVSEFRRAKMIHSMCNVEEGSVGRESGVQPDANSIVEDNELMNNRL